MGGHMVWFANESTQCGGVDVRDVYTDSYLTDLGVTISGATADQRVQALVSAILAGTKLSGQFGGSLPAMIFQIQEIARQLVELSHAITLQIWQIHFMRWPMFLITM